MTVPDPTIFSTTHDDCFVSPFFSSLRCAQNFKWNRFIRGSSLLLYSNFVIKGHSREQAIKMSKVVVYGAQVEKLFSQF